MIRALVQTQARQGSSLSAEKRCIHRTVTNGTLISTTSLSGGTLLIVAYPVDDVAGVLTLSRTLSSIV
jgi:hypothetical protein